MTERAETPMRGGEWLFANLPGEIKDSLNDEQNRAIRDAADRGAWGRHPVNIRLSLPFIHKRFFLTVVSGEERRHPERRGMERKHHPLHTAGNVLFAVGIAVVFTVAAVFAVAIQSSLVEF